MTASPLDTWVKELNRHFTNRMSKPPLSICKEAQPHCWSGERQINTILRSLYKPTKITKMQDRQYRCFQGRRDLKLTYVGRGWLDLTNITLKERSQTQTVHTVGFCSYKVPRQTSRTWESGYASSGWEGTEECTSGLLECWFWKLLDLGAIFMDVAS